MKFIILNVINTFDICFSFLDVLYSLDSSMKDFWLNPSWLNDNQGILSAWSMVFSLIGTIILPISVYLAYKAIYESINQSKKEEYIKRKSKIEYIRRTLIDELASHLHSLDRIEQSLLSVDLDMPEEATAIIIEIVCQPDFLLELDYLERLHLEAILRDTYRLNTCIKRILDTAYLNIGNANLILELKSILYKTINSGLESIRLNTFHHWEFCVKNTCTDLRNSRQYIKDLTSKLKNQGKIAFSFNSMDYNDQELIQNGITEYYYWRDNGIPESSRAQLKYTSLQKLTSIKSMNNEADIQWGYTKSPLD